MFEKVEKGEKNPWLDLGGLEPAAIQLALERLQVVRMFSVSFSQARPVCSAAQQTSVYFSLQEPRKCNGGGGAGAGVL